MSTLLRFFTDPHIGRELKANTTPASRAQLQQQLFLYAEQAATCPPPSAMEGRKVRATICGGDLFDTDHNPEHIILQGAKIAARCDVLLGGNHDVINVTGRESSLSAIAKLTGRESIIQPPGPGQVYWHHVQYGEVDLFTVPHHALQEHFEKALDQALASAKTSPAKRKLLLLHCNWNMRLDVGENDLNLTEAKAQKLLEQFDYLILGHDHRPRRELGGRVIILGNTHPTSFSDLGEKYVWFYDSEGNEWHQQPTCADCSKPVEAEELIRLHRENELSQLENVEWLDVVGELEPAASVDLAKAVRALWKGNDYLYAVRMAKVVFKNLDQADKVEAGQVMNLMQLIEHDLQKNPEMLGLFREARDLKEI